jgi:hypothetical protein
MSVFTVTVSGTVEAGSENDVRNFLTREVEPGARSLGVTGTRLVSIERQTDPSDAYTAQNDAERAAVMACLAAFRTSELQGLLG